MIMSRRALGRLTRTCITKMKEYLSLRLAGGCKEADQLPAIVQAYVSSILQPAADEQLGLGNSQELAVLAESLDALSLGDAPRALDVLSCRFQAEETSASQSK